MIKGSEKQPLGTRHELEWWLFRLLATTQMANRTREWHTKGSQSSTPKPQTEVLTTTFSSPP